MDYRIEFDERVVTLTAPPPTITRPPDEVVRNRGSAFEIIPQPAHMLITAPTFVSGAEFVTVDPTPYRRASVTFGNAVADFGPGTFRLSSGDVPVLVIQEEG